MNGYCQGLGKRRKESLFNGYKGSVWDHGTVLEMDNGDGYMYLTLLNHTLKVVTMVNFT